MTRAPCLNRRSALLWAICSLMLAGLAPPWDARLEALRPSQPMAYFELAEEISDTARTAQEQEVARHLFAMAGALDPVHLGRSACLALADLEENALVKRRLTALASLLGPSQSGGGGGTASSNGPELGGAAALAASEALGHYRRGRGAQALSALRKPGATDLLRYFERMLPGGLDRFIEDCKVYTAQTKPTLSPA